MCRSRGEKCSVYHALREMAADEHPPLTVIVSGERRATRNNPESRTGSACRCRLLRTLFTKSTLILIFTDLKLGIERHFQHSWLKITLYMLAREDRAQHRASLGSGAVFAQAYSIELSFRLYELASITYWDLIYYGHVRLDYRATPRSSV